MEHKIFVTFANGSKQAFIIKAATRQEAKFIMFNRIFKYACICKKYVGASVAKFNPQTYLARVSA